MQLDVDWQFKNSLGANWNGAHCNGILLECSDLFEQNDIIPSFQELNKYWTRPERCLNHRRATCWEKIPSWLYAYPKCAPLESLAIDWWMLEYQTVPFRRDRNGIMSQPTRSLQRLDFRSDCEGMLLISATIWTTLDSSIYSTTKLVDWRCTQLFRWFEDARATSSVVLATVLHNQTIYVFHHFVWY